MSVQHGQVGKFKVLDLLGSVGAWSGWQGLQICNILQWPDLARPAIGTCRLVAGQPLAWFDQCSWLLFNPNCSVGLWQICNVATLPGESFAWQQVGNLQCCSMGRLAALQVHGQVGNILQRPDLQDLQLDCRCSIWPVRVLLVATSGTLAVSVQQWAGWQV